ncbi:ATP-binding protein [Methylobacterium haplocladii]|uniref:histidine kinase n=1 Tax=Methylobacterium haplocladii TaxID=1176176 RepID=A0A512IVD1_9HYPH|nr:ATP-binding protein [Methylobacterium haplocladii]GEP01665.1 two-component sensor histidine kinase [Methylobacterium haplocladii]GJD85770.1 Adaptive-response sensory-kinase SasA [Methylobacterium haplocladii]GLS59923.1 two-component sensor histidine kinase [Methylobacterium haplocladii]
MPGSVRRSAFAGASAATIAFGIAALVDGTPGIAFLLAASFALVVGTVLSRSGAPIVAPPESERRERHSVAESLLANIPDPVILVDRRIVVIEANPAARALLPGLKLRHPLSFALRSPDVLDGIEEVLQSGAPLKTGYVTRVPTERAFEVQIGALPPADTPGGGQPNVVLFLRDLTSARRLEAMRVDFVANASHELRTPLASLSGFIETLQGPARDDPRAREQFLGIMRTQAQRMTRLIDDLLSLSRIELREHVPPTQIVCLKRIARQMVEEKAPLAAERGIALTLDAPEPPYSVLGDRDELLRVVENLVENALKYGGSGGLVAVSLGREEASGNRPPQLTLSVRDAGPGIAPEHIPRLTERFYRVDTASSRQQGGTGLGLAIVKHALNRHRGRFVIESEVGQGTTMRVILPEHRTGDQIEAPDMRPVDTPLTFP